uniref:Reverse transcriptase domain-containing protein n=1 Tax=Caenorhabditis japonica TaxID=281687 RepID=A0A8R1E3T5_CAEJA
MVPSPKNSEKEISTELLDAQEAGEELKSDPKAENPGNQSQKADSKKGKLNETERAAIPKLMAIKLKTPPKVEPVRRNPEKGENYQKGQPNKKRQIPTGKPDELVKKVREWFEIQFQAYFEDGKSFQRLEWLTGLLTAAIHKASAGDEQAVGKIIKRCPPLEIEEGEMATQTETKQKPKNQKSTKGANSSSSIREAYAENRARTFNKIIGQDDKYCEIPIEKIEKFFENTTSNTNVPTKTLARITSDLPKLEIGSWIEEEFKEKEVAEALQKTKDTAPGVDGLRTAIEAAKGTKKSLSIAWLDLTNAFGSVPHELIEATLIAYGFPGMVTEVIKDMYNGASIRVKTKNEKSKQILIKSGVKQGDPISPTLFNICLESVIRRYLKSADGHKCIGSNIKLLAFADDMAILSDSKTKLQQELQKMDDDCTPLNLIFKPAKCASLIIEWGKVQKDQKIKLKGQFIRSLAEQDTYKYLGVQTGIETRISAMHLMKKTVSELDKINCSELAPWQKLDAVKTFVLPRMTYMYANTVPKLSELKEFANITMRAIKVMQNIPVKGSPLEYVQLPIGKGGLGVACPKTTALITYLVSTMKKLWSTDDYIRKLHTDYLKMVAIKETKTKEVTLEDLASYLSDDKTVCKKAVGYNSFTRVREICRTLSKNKEALLSQLKIIENNGKLAILVQAVKDGKTKIFTNEHVNTLQKVLKKEINESPSAQIHNWKKSEKRSDGGKVSIGAHRFVHKARLNLLACNYNTWQDAATKQCRRCGHERETQWHILSSCPKSMGGKITERHDSVLKTVKEMIQTGSLKNWKLKLDHELPGSTRLRPDIYLRSPNGSEIILGDVTIPYEHRIEAMQTAWQKKIEQYEEGFKYLRSTGKKLTIVPIVVGALGSWWKPTTDSLVSLGIDKNTVKRAIPEICSTVLEYSKNIYWNHIFGDSYQKVPMFFGGEKPKGQSWKKVKPPEGKTASNHQPPGKVADYTVLRLKSPEMAQNNLNLSESALNHAQLGENQGQVASRNGLEQVPPPETARLRMDGKAARLMAGNSVGVLVDDLYPRAPTKRNPGKGKLEKVFTGLVIV